MAPIAVLLFVVASTAGAAAASLALSSGSIGAARVTTPRCTATGLTVTHNLVAATVASVSVSGLPSSCEAATLQVTVNNGLASSSGTATIPTGGGSVTVALAVPPAVTTADETDLVMLGP